MRYIIYLAILALAGPPAIAAGCETKLAPLTFEAIKARKSELRAKNQLWLFSGEFLTDFYGTGWQRMLSVARDSGVTVHDLLADALEMIDLHRDEVASRLLTSPPSFIMSERIRVFITPLTLIPPDMAHWGDDEGYALIGAAIAMRSLALHVVLAQKVLGHSPNLDPFASMDAAWMDTLLDDLQLISLDFAAGLSEVISFALTTLGTPQPYVEPTPVAPPPEPTYAEIVRQSAPPFDADHPYPVTLISKAEPRTVTVTLSADLVKDLNGAQSAQAVRLLRALGTPQTKSSGVKALPSLGHRIVEVKARMHGHWRIMGCLENDRLRLLSLMDMPDTVAGYSKRIDKNFCAD